MDFALRFEDCTQLFSSLLCDYSSFICRWLTGIERPQLHHHCPTAIDRFEVALDILGVNPSPTHCSDRGILLLLFFSFTRPGMHSANTIARHRSHKGMYGCLAMLESDGGRSDTWASDLYVSSLDVQFQEKINEHCSASVMRRCHPSPLPNCTWRCKEVRDLTQRLRMGRRFRA